MARQKSTKQKSLKLVRSATGRRENDRLESLLENIYTDFQVVGEQIEGLEEKMERRFDRLEHKVGEINRRLIRVEAKVLKLEEDMQEVKQEIKLIRLELRGKVDREEFVQLEKRVIKLESKVGISQK